MGVRYTLRYRTADVGSGAGTWTEITDLTGTSRALTGLDAATRYDVEVVAVSDGGVESTPVSGARWTLTTAPDAPTASTVRAETLDLSWDAVAGAASYRVERTPAGGGATTVVGTVTAPTTGLAVTGLTEQTGYDLRVVAVNGDGADSAASGATAATTLALATGGSITSGTGTADGYRIHEFTADGTFTLNADRDVEYLVVGGGGGGGAHVGGGGGGGGVLSGTATIVAGTSESVTVGAGGIGAEHFATGNDNARLALNGGASSFGSHATALGGGAGGSWTWQGAGDGATGGGDGGDVAWGAGSIGSGTAGQGADGGLGVPNTSSVWTSGYGYPTGGGGGASLTGDEGVGGDATATSSGNGGRGRESSITGAAVRYGGGGGGGVHGNGSSNAAAGVGSDGGGNGVRETTTAAGDGEPGRGGGGGGAGNPNSSTSRGGDGGSGVVILRYRVSSD